MTKGSDTLYFAYDASGPMSVTCNGKIFYYVKNLQGDVTAILDSNGVAAVTYSYDAWGKVLSIGGYMAGTLGTLNPLRYRGYVYDQETGLYYLQTRYYNPTLGRFISADEFASTGQGQLGNNMFAYCGNNPIVREDTFGNLWFTGLAALAGAAINVTTTFIAAKATGQEYTWKDAAVAGVAGAANAIPVWGPLVNGLVTGVYTGYMSIQNGATLGEAALCGVVAGVLNTASISNLANLTPGLASLAANAAADLVFGTGYNSMAAGVYRAVTDNAQARNANAAAATGTPVQSSISTGRTSTLPSTISSRLNRTPAFRGRIIYDMPI